MRRKGLLPSVLSFAVNFLVITKQQTKQHTTSPLTYSSASSRTSSAYQQSTNIYCLCYRAKKLKLTLSCYFKVSIIRSLLIILRRKRIKYSRKCEVIYCKKPVKASRRCLSLRILLNCCITI